MAGRPSEFFGPTLIEEIVSNDAVIRASDIDGYMDAVKRYAATENGVFGMKILALQTGIFLQRAAEHKKIPFASLKTAFESEFPQLKYIWLRRNNLVAQAISYYCAVKTQRFFSFQKTAQPPQVAYNRFAIQRCYQAIIAEETYWEGYFKAHNITPLTITYEELLQDRVPIMQHILRYLDLPSALSIPEPKTARLTHEQAAAWEEEFRSTGGVPEPWVMPKALWAPY